jgi:hypothetical protein
MYDSPGDEYTDSLPVVGQIKHPARNPMDDDVDEREDPPVDVDRVFRAPPAHNALRNRGLRPCPYTAPDLSERDALWLRDPLGALESASYQGDESGRLGADSPTPAAAPTAAGKNTQSGRTGKPPPAQRASPAGHTRPSGKRKAGARQWPLGEQLPQLPRRLDADQAAT